MNRFYKCASTSRGMAVESITLRQVVAESRWNNRGAGFLIVAARDESSARHLAANYGAAADSGTVAERFAVDIRGPGRGVAVISEAAE